MMIHTQYWYSLSNKIKYSLASDVIKCVSSTNSKNQTNEKVYSISHAVEGSVFLCRTQLVEIEGEPEEGVD